MALAMDRNITREELEALWIKYTHYRSRMLAASTISRDYGKVASVIRRMPESSSSIEIRNWLLQKYSFESARRLLVQFNACCKWGKVSGYLKSNPFKNLAKGMLHAHHAEDYRAFSVEERDRIILTFLKSKPQYAPWVKFLFWTGCRPEEAAALAWFDISAAGIWFRYAAPYEKNDIQGTKTHTQRVFPINERLKRLLSEIRPFPSGAGRIFPDRNGNPFDYHNFQNRHWKPLVELLAESGAISQYLSQYHCRHTFCTLALQAGLPIADIAYLVGNSPKTIWTHYAGRSREIEVPEF